MAFTPGSTTPRKLVTSILTILSTARWGQAMEPSLNTTTTTVIALALPQTGVDVSSNDGDEESPGYFKLSEAVQSVMQLAADDVNASGDVMEGTLILEVLEVNTAMSAVQELCDELERLGDTGAYGVGSFATKTKKLVFGNHRRAWEGGVPGYTGCVVWCLRYSKNLRARALRVRLRRVGLYNCTVLYVYHNIACSSTNHKANPRHKVPIRKENSDCRSALILRQ